MVLREVDRNEATPPQASRQGTKNDRSPWTAPRERKRRGKQAQEVEEEPAQLSSVEELEYTTSPPKRHNGGTTTQSLPSAAPLGSPFEASAAAARSVVGPLAQGMLAPGAAPIDTGFSPLASGLAAPTFSAGLHHPWQACDKQRKQVRQASAFRQATSKQRAAAASAAAAAVPPTSSSSLACGAEGSTAGAGAALPPPPALFNTFLWQRSEPVPPPASTALQLPFGTTAVQEPVQQIERPQQQQQPCEANACRLPHLPVPAPAPAPSHVFSQPAALAAAAGMQHADQVHADEQQAVAGTARCSTGQDMETDMRSSWGSERSADISGWQSIQAQLRDETGLMQPRPQPFSSSLEMESSGRQEPAGTSGPGQGMEGSLAVAAGVAAEPSADAPSSLRSSWEAPGCTERQTSLVPLRGSTRSQHWSSHLASHAADGASPDPLLGRTPGSRQRGRGGSRWNCFSCASPFSCKAGVQDDSDGEEVVRRNPDTDPAEDFVIHRKQSFPPPSASREDRASGERPRRTTLNRPPVGDDQEDVAHRQDAFSARCGTTPGAPWSPFSEAESDDSFSLASGPGPACSAGLRDQLADLASGGSDGGTPTVDALNDMLKMLSLCPEAHPRDAEELVAQACQNNDIQPNATTVRTLEKMWAVHEQLYG